MAVHVCGDDSGGDAVDPDAGGACLLGEGAGQPDQRRFGCGIVRLAGGAGLPPHGGDVQDAATVALQKQGQQPPCQIRRTQVIDPVEPGGTFRGQALEQLRFRYGSVVHQQLQPAGGGNLLCQGSIACGIGYVRPDGHGTGAGGKLLCGGFALTIGEPDPASLGGKDPDACGADAPGSSGDERDRFHTRLLSAACKTGGNVIQWETTKWEGWI